MKDVKALFIDCDGVLYNKDQCTDYDMVEIGFGTTFEQYHIPFDKFHQKRTELKQQGIRGVWNPVLALCNEHNISFEEFARNVVTHTNYSRISADSEMLVLLKQVGAILPIYIVTNNSTPHLNKIFSCLNGGTPLQNPQKELNIHFIAIENTLSDGIFHSKKMKKQFTNLCKQIGLTPHKVLLLDDSTSVREAALEQGLQITKMPIETSEDTKQILKHILDLHTKDNL